MGEEEQEKNKKSQAGFWKDIVAQVREDLKQGLQEEGIWKDVVDQIKESLKDIADVMDQVKETLKEEVREGTLKDVASQMKETLEEELQGGTLEGLIAWVKENSKNLHWEYKELRGASLGDLQEALQTEGWRVALLWSEPREPAERLGQEGKGEGQEEQTEDHLHGFLVRVKKRKL
ncbi:MAG: hypothetical protein ACE5JP_05015 [Candidatus Bipolaricaulia bacterium]